MINSRPSMTRALSLFCALLAIVLTAVSPVYAAGTTLQLSPASGVLAPGSTFPVAVRVNTGDQSINAVQANFSYPANLVEFVRISAADSAFEIGAPSSGGNGKVSIARAQLGGVSSNDALVATVMFRVVADSGTVSMAFTQGTEALSNKDGGNVLNGTTGAAYTIGSGSSGSGSMPVVPGQAGNTTPPPNSTTPATPSPGNDPPPSPTDVSPMASELKNDTDGAAGERSSELAGSKVPLWGISGLVLAVATTVAITYFKRRHAAASFVRPSSAAYGYAHTAVVSPPAYGQRSMVTANQTPAARPYSQPVQNESGQFHGGQIQPVIVRPSQLSVAPQQPVAAQPQQGGYSNFNNLSSGSDP